MKQLFIGVFAHPDDEAFGPSGTLVKAALDGADVHLICATGGESGINADGHDDLARIRIQEWHAAGALIGATSQVHLGFNDGELNNNQFHGIAAALESEIQNILQKYEDQPIEITFITFDMNGLSGHIDHIVMSMVTSYCVSRLQDDHLPQVTHIELRYYCIPESEHPEPTTGFVYMSRGRSPQDIDITVDIRNVAEKKRAIICAHHTQRHDAEMILKLPSTLSEEHFYLAR